jgi:hypothetical protein
VNKEGLAHWGLSRQTNKQTKYFMPLLI